MCEYKFKRPLIYQAQIQKDHRILDLGCGTATLTIFIKQIHPEAEVIGLDSDPTVLAIARIKSIKAEVNINLDRGQVSELPYPNNFFDRVLSSLFFHHLTHDNKICALREILRVLKPNGELHVVDFGKPKSSFMYLISLIMRRLEETSDNIKGLLPTMFRDVGFEQVKENTQYMTIFGSLSLYQARKPEENSLSRNF